MVRLTQHTIKTPYLVGPVHCYSGTFADELVLFDTGPPTPDAENYLRESLSLQRLQHVIITHCHIDHYGQARWLEENSDATIYLPYRDSLKISQHDKWVSELYKLLAGVGFNNEFLEKLFEIFNSRATFPPFSKKFKIAEKEIPERLGITVLECPGHSQSDLVYTGDGWAVTGDTLLKGVFQSPLLDVDLVGGGRYKNYEMYCNSIVKLAGLNGKTILPSHSKPITNISEVLIFYISKLLQRVAQLLPYKNENNLQLLIHQLLDGRMQDPLHVYFKASEILFMKDFLDWPDLLRESLEEIGLFSEVADLYGRVIQSRGRPRI